MTSSKTLISPEDRQHLNDIYSHINRVRENCQRLAFRIIDEDGDLQLAKNLLRLGLTHDQSKISNSVEWEHLRRGKESTEEFKLALESHQSSNPHHPEYWPDINAMPDMYLAEWLCDCKARSEEFGTDFREWIKTSACERFNISKQGKVWKKIKHYIDLLLETPFE